MYSKVNIGIVGLGDFSRYFFSLLGKHPGIGKVYAADLSDERREKAKANFNFDAVYTSLDEMLDQADDLNSVAIFTERHLHGKMVLQCLDRGVNVFSAVPTGVTVEENFEIAKKVEETHLIYMMAETCYYFPCAVFCRKKFADGEFGKFIYGEAEYYHTVYGITYNREKPETRGIPPMFYPTHSCSMLFSAINEHAAEVSCFGIRHQASANIYGEENNIWKNPFSDEVAIFRMSGGGIARINEFRGCAWNKPSSFIQSLMGTKAGYQSAGMHHILQKEDRTTAPFTPSVEFYDSLINAEAYENESRIKGENIASVTMNSHNGYSPIHDTHRLPKAFREMKGVFHNGSHSFLIDDFVRAVLSGKLPPNNIWDAASYMIPGLIAHESAMQGGKTLKIPSVGEIPADWEMIDYDDKVYEDEK